MRNEKWMKAGLTALAWIGMSIHAYGQSRVELDERLKIVEKRLRQMEAPVKSTPTETPAPSAKVEMISSEKGGIVFNAPNGGYSLKLGGFVEMDGRLFMNGSRTFSANTLLVRRARIDLQPSFDKVVGFRLQGDFAGASATLKDAYAWAKFTPALQILAGRFKPPTSLDRLQGDPDQVFMEKALSTNLTPDRDLGIMFSAKFGDFGTGAMEVSNGSADNTSLDTDTENAKTWSGRLFFTPFAKLGTFLDGFGVGIAGDYGVENGVVPSYVTSGQLTFFSYKAGVKTGSDHYRLSPQGQFYWGPLSVVGEYLLSSSGLVNGANSGRVVHSGWQGTVSNVFGGKAAYGGAMPDKPFDLSKGQLGALELGFRVSELDLDQAAFDGGFADPNASARRALSYELAVNWIPENRFKVSLNWEWTEFQGGASAGGDRLPEEVFLTRIQSFF